MKSSEKEVIRALQFNNNLPELKKYFNKEPFTQIKFDATSKKTIMIDSGYTYNLTTKFWRVLKTIELIKTHKNNIHMSNYLLEVFTSQCLAFIDILARWVKHFLKIEGLKMRQLSVHNDKFIEKFINKLSNDSHNKQIQEYHAWSKDKLYPYRNILHHMGELSGSVLLDPK